jgi:hypothetical protein
VTDHDIRKPEILEIVCYTIAEYPIEELEDEMEVHLYVQNHKEPRGISTAFLSLAVNHKHCVASYTLAEILDESVPLLNPRPRVYIWMSID